MMIIINMSKLQFNYSNFTMDKVITEYLKMGNTALVLGIC